MGADWNQTVAKVKKIMGDKTKIPDFPSNLVKASKEYDKAWDEFDKARGAAEDKLLAWQNTVSTFGNTANVLFARGYCCRDSASSRCESCRCPHRNPAGKAVSVLSPPFTLLAFKSNTYSVKGNA